MLNLKIQRLKADDFFVSISCKGLVTQLKEEILRFLKTAQVKDEDSQPGVTNLRLIYKGKVLMDCKTIEFYKIENDDTIQLVPYRRRKPPEDLPTSGTENGGIEIENKEGGELPGFSELRGTGEITYIQFSVSEGLPPRNSEFGQLYRSFFEDDLAVRTPPVQSPRSADAALRAVNRPTPLTVSGSLRSFRHVLGETLRRVMEPGDGARELVSQLNTLISSANILRENLIRDSLAGEEVIRNAPVADHRGPPMPPLEEEPEHALDTGVDPRPSQLQGQPQQIPPTSQSILEILLREAIDSSASPDSLAEDEKTNSPPEAPLLEQLGLVSTQNESINFAPETFPSVLRVLRPRFDERVAAPLTYHPFTGNLTALSVSRAYTDATVNRDELNSELSQESHERARYFDIFTHFMNRFN